MRRQTVALLLLTVLGGLGAACSDEAPAGAPAGGFRIPVTWARVEPGRVVETVELVGDVLSQRWAGLAFERPGRVVEVLVDLGDDVSEGQVLARLDDELIERELDVAQALVESARIDAAFADREARRGSEAGLDVLSASEQDRRAAAAATAGARLAQREAEAARLQAVLAQGQLRAPFDGVVASRQITLGSHATPGQPAFALVDLEHREVHVEIPAPIATSLTVGIPVELRVDHAQGLVITATMDELVPTASLSSRTFIGVVRLDGLEGADMLLPGMFVRARFAQTTADSRTVVPADAVLDDGLGARVVVMDVSADGEAPRARIVQVTVLATDNMRAAVQADEPNALQPGDRVIVTGADSVFPGALLAPVPSLVGASGADTKSDADVEAQVDTGTEVGAEVGASPDARDPAGTY